MNQPRNRHPWTTFGLIVGMALAAASPGLAQESDSADDIQETRQQIVSSAVQYLKGTGQAEDGSYSSFAGTAITSLVTTGLTVIIRYALQKGI